MPVRHTIYLNSAPLNFEPNLPTALISGWKIKILLQTIGYCCQNIQFQQSMGYCEAIIVRIILKIRRSDMYDS